MEKRSQDEKRGVLGGGNPAQKRFPPQKKTLKKREAWKKTTKGKIGGAEPAKGNVPPPVSELHKPPEGKKNHGGKKEDGWNHLMKKKRKNKKARQPISP